MTGDVRPPEQASGVDSDGTACWMHVAGESWPGRVSRWRRDPDGWRGFVTYSRREPAGLLTYMHWGVAANLSPRDEDSDHPAIPTAGRMSAGGHLDSIWTGQSLDHAKGGPPERETGL